MNLSIPELKSGTFERLTTYHWYVNVRELENVIKRLLIQASRRGVAHKSWRCCSDRGSSFKDNTDRFPSTPA